MVKLNSNMVNPDMIRPNADGHIWLFHPEMDKLTPISVEKASSLMIQGLGYLESTQHLVLFGPENY